MKYAAAIATVLLFMAVMGALGWYQPSELEAVGHAQSTTTTVATSTTSATPITSLPPTTLADITVPMLPEIVEVPGRDSLAVGSPHSFVAVSALEVWAVLNSDATGPNLIGHLVEAQWTYYQTTASRWGTFGLATAGDGTVWAATDVGVFSFGAGHWTRRWSHPASGITVAPDGTVWIGGRREGLGGPTDPRLWLARWDGANWTRVDQERHAAPEVFTGTRIAAMAGDSVWIAQRPGFWVEDDLMHFDGVTMEVVDVPGIPDPTPDNNMPAIRVFEVEATPSGELWIAAYVNAEPSRGILARFDGIAWVLYDWPSPRSAEVPVEADLSAGPDGTMWLADGNGLFAFDGHSWLSHIEGVAAHSVDVAPDGSVWYSADSGIHLLQPP